MLPLVVVASSRGHHNGYFGKLTIGRLDDRKYGQAIDRSGKPRAPAAGWYWPMCRKRSPSPRRLYWLGCVAAQPGYRAASGDAQDQCCRYKPGGVPAVLPVDLGREK